MKKRNDRIIFYSKNDLSIGYELKKIDELLKIIDIEDSFSINDFLEFYSICRYFKEELYLSKWNNNIKEKYILLSKNLCKKTASFFNNQINNNNFKEIFNEIEFNYITLFYNLFDKFQLYKKIDVNIIINILNEKPYLIECILKYKDIINFYENDIKDFLIGYDRTTELFLDKLEGDKLFFPKSLNIEEKEEIILSYLKNDNIEYLNKVEHISKLKDSNFLKLSKKTILLAKNKHKVYLENFLKKGNNGIKFSYGVGLSEEQEEDIIIENNNPLQPKITYSIKILKFLYDNKGISYLFRNIFYYIDNKGNIDLVSRKSEISTFMDLFSGKIKGEYKTGTGFQFKEVFSLLNLKLFIDYLNNFHKKNISYLIEHFIKNLRLYNGFKDVFFRVDSIDKIENYTDIIKIIIPEFDLFIKQFICFVEEGKIDFDLISLGDGFLYRNIPSLLKDKYFYEKDEKLKNLKYYFFSDQSGLFYIEGFENKYNNFFDLLKNEDLTINNFSDYQITIINLFIKENILFLNKQEYIKIVNDKFIFLIGEIYKKEVISYYGYSNSLKEEILIMKEKGLLYSKSTLLSNMESDYFNYYLNNIEFINSIAIRNKNLHGYFYKDQNEAYTNFLIILKLIILIFIKIEDEFYIYEKLKKRN